jgi:polyisoprenoid-binding protein YceI
MKIKWEIDLLNSVILFRSKYQAHSTISGCFTAFNLEMETTDRFINASKLLITASTNSLFTNRPQKDEQLKSKEFFDVQEYPTIKFTANRFEHSDVNLRYRNIIPNRKNYFLHGDLTIKNISKPVILETIFEGVALNDKEQAKACLNINGEINPGDFNLRWTKKMKNRKTILSDKIHFHCEIQMIKQ